MSVLRTGDFDALLEKRSFPWQRANPGGRRVQDNSFAFNENERNKVAEKAKEFVKCPPRTLYNGEKCIVPPADGTANELVTSTLRSLHVSHMHNRPPDLKQYMNQRPASEYATLEDKRKAVGEYVESLKSNPILRASVETKDVTAGELCHLVIDDRPTSDTYGLGNIVVMPWQLVAQYHVMNDNLLSDKVRVTVLHHGMGSGKSVTLGMMLYNSAKNSSPGEKYTAWLLCPVKTDYARDEMPTVAETERALAQYVEEMVKVFWVGNGNGAPTVADKFNSLMARESLDNDNLKTGKRAIRRFALGSNVIAYYPSAKADAAASEYVDENETENFHRFVERERNGVDDETSDEEYPEPAGWNEDDGEPVGIRNKWIDGALDKIRVRLRELATRYEPGTKNHLILIDESHNFFASEERFRQLNLVVNTLLDHSSTNKVRIVLSSGTPFSVTDASLFRRFQVLMDTLASDPRINGVAGDLWNVTLFEKIPPALAAQQSKRAIKIDTRSVYGDVEAPVFQYFKKSDGDGFLLSDIRSDSTLDVKYILPLQKALVDFFEKCAADDVKHLKCIIAVPNAWAVIVNDRVSHVTHIEPEESVTAVSVYALLRDYLAQRPTALDHEQGTRIFGIQEFGHNAARARATILKYAFYEKEYRVGGRVRTGAQIFGEVGYLKDSSVAVAEKRRMMGLADDVPDAQILFVDPGAIGLDLAGVSSEYFLHNSASPEEFDQLVYRGIRLCSLAGFPDADFRTQLVTVGFAYTDVPIRTAGQKRPWNRVLSFLRPDKDALDEERLHTVDLRNDTKVSMYYARALDFAEGDQADAARMALQRIVARHNYVTSDKDDAALMDATTGEFSNTVVLDDVGELYAYISGQNPLILVHFLAEARTHYATTSSRMFKPPLPHAELVTSLLDVLKGGPVTLDRVPLKVGVKNLDVIIEFLKQYESKIKGLLKQSLVARPRDANAPKQNAFPDDGLSLNENAFLYMYLTGGTETFEKAVKQWKFSFRSWDDVARELNTSIDGDAGAFAHALDKAAATHPKERFASLGSPEPVQAAIRIANKTISELGEEEKTLMMADILKIRTPSKELFENVKFLLRGTVWDALGVRAKICSAWGTFTPAQKGTCAEETARAMRVLPRQAGNDISWFTDPKAFITRAYDAGTCDDVVLTTDKKTLPRYLFPVSTDDVVKDGDYLGAALADPTQWTLVPLTPLLSERLNAFKTTLRVHSLDQRNDLWAVYSTPALRSAVDKIFDYIIKHHALPSKLAYSP